MSGAKFPRGAAGGRRAAVAVALIVLTSSLTGCATPFGGDGDGDDRPHGARTPTAVTIGGAGLRDADVTELRVREGEKVAAPDNGVAWLTTSAVPGAKGAAVLSGRIGAKERPGTLHAVGRVAIGDEAVVEHADGSRTTFTVDRIQMISRGLPTVEGVTKGADRRELRIVAVAPPPEKGEKTADVGLLLSATAR
ncbi:class F sortase [Streptomyces sp. NPDC047315]|uniref:class F sortase n=1 Tax=Streptomyces sp. NPDC047315 TaxID=3155142 RepID=UPI0033CC1C7C